MSASFAAALRRPSLMKRSAACGCFWDYRTRHDVRFAKIFIPSDVDNIGYGNRIDGKSHISRRPLHATIGTGSLDSVRLMVDPSRQA